MTLLELINNSNLKEVEEKNLKSSNNIEKVKSFASFLDTKNTKSDCYILYRGHNKNGFWQNLKNSTNSDERFSKYEKLFMLGGGKAKQYLKSTKSKFIIDIRDTSSKMAEQIFSDINKHTSALSKNNQNNEEKELVEYFNNEGKKGHFISTIKNSITIRDYYLLFLHTKDSNKNNYTYLISTSTNWNKAEEFANNGYIICMFYPQPLKNYGLNLSIANNEIKTKLLELSLPIIKRELFEDEFEVSIRGALFPHYMLGIYDLCKKEFIVNPHFIKDNNNNSNILRHGININQSNFETFLNDSDYINGVTRLYNGLYKNYK